MQPPHGDYCDRVGGSRHDAGMRIMLVVVGGNLRISRCIWC